jgi:flagellar biosynthetic protein FlhB
VGRAFLPVSSFLDGLEGPSYDMPEQFGDKQYEATPYRRQQAREKGHVVKSQDVGSAALLLVGMGAMLWLGRPVIDYLAGVTTRHLGDTPWLTADKQTVVAAWNAAVWDMASYLLPLLAALFAIAVAASLMQTGWTYVPSRVLPDWNRVNPLAGTARVFSSSNFMRIALGLVKMIVVGLVTFYSLYGRRDELLALTSLALPQFAVYLADILLWTTLKIAAALLALSGVDYLFQRLEYERDLRMTTQELKEELKLTQGNPETAQRRRVLRQLARQNMLNAVSKADFVLRNPAGVAVAITHAADRMNAPVVSAKGAGATALRIRQIAEQHGVPVIERKPLAQSLYKLVDVNRSIPRNFYEPIGELLRYASELKSKAITSSPLFAGANSESSREGVG